MRWPDSGFVQNHDLAPTILDYLGLQAPMDGVSFRPLVERRPRKWVRDFVITGWAGFGGEQVGCASVRDRRWNAIFNLGRPASAPLLFDLKADPLEQSDVAARRAAVVAERQGRLEALLGGSLPFAFNEKAGGGPAPSDVFLRARATVAAR